jgi:hypothetical protein
MLHPRQLQLEKGRGQPVKLGIRAREFPIPRHHFCTGAVKPVKAAEPTK